MAYEWPIDKLGMIDSALALTGDNQVSVADDGSDEWNTCSPAYERGLAYIIESHSWGFAKISGKVLQPSPTAPANTDWDTAFPIPQDLVHLIWLKINQDTQDPSTQTVARFALYDIEVVGGVSCIVCNAMGGPPPPPVGTATPAIVTCEYISNQAALADSTSGTPTLILALQSFVMAGIYSGLHEDPAQGATMWKEGEVMLQKARTRYDQQKPKRQFFNSRMAASRYVRRPWPPRGIGGWNSGGGPPG